MKKDRILKIVSHNFSSYKVSYTVSVFALSGVLNILGNKFGTLYLVLAFLPVLAWGVHLIMKGKINVCN